MFLSKSIIILSTLRLFLLFCAMKYIHKYISKKHNCTTIQIRNEEGEVKQYIELQYIRPFEVAWLLFGMKIHEKVLNVV